MEYALFALCLKCAELKRSSESACVVGSTS